MCKRFQTQRNHSISYAGAPAQPVAVSRSVKLAVADSMFSPKTGNDGSILFVSFSANVWYLPESAPSGADLLSEGILDGVWAAEHVAQKKAE